MSVNILTFSFYVFFGGFILSLFDAKVALFCSYKWLQFLYIFLRVVSNNIVVFFWNVVETS